MRQQYRISTDSNGTSNFGYAYLLISNVSGSGRKITLRSLEVYLHSVQTNVALPATLYMGASVSGGEDMRKNSVLCDSTASFPTSVVVYRGGMINSYGSPIQRIDVGRRGGAVGGQNRLLMGTAMTVGASNRRSLSGMYRSPVVNAALISPVRVNQNEAVALVMDPKAESCTNPLRVNIVMSINNKTVVFDFNSNPYPGQSIFALSNSGTDTVKLLSYGVMDMGTTDTPTLRIVPAGKMYATDINDTSRQNIGVTKMDSAYADLSSSVCRLYTDVGFLPSGVPEVAISPASTGTPAGMNYLHTRDFWGPVYRNLLVEACHMKGVGSGMPGTFGCSYSHVLSDPLIRRSGITINPGEAIAVVNSAETAVGVQAAFGAWQPMTFSAQIDVEPQFSPKLTLTGLVSGSDVVILSPGTTTVLTSADQNAGTTYSWNYDPDIVSAADIAIYKTGYKPTSLRNVALGVDGLTVPVSQPVDPDYID